MNTRHKINTVTDITATYNEQILNEIFHEGDASDDCQSARTQDYYDRQPQSFEGLWCGNERPRYLLKKYVARNCSNEAQDDLKDDLNTINECIECADLYRDAMHTISVQLKMLPCDLVLEFLEAEFEELGVEAFYNEYGISHPDNFA